MTAGSSVTNDETEIGVPLLSRGIVRDKPEQQLRARYPPKLEHVELDGLLQQMEHFITVRLNFTPKTNIRRLKMPFG